MLILCILAALAATVLAPAAFFRGWRGLHRLVPSIFSVLVLGCNAGGLLAAQDGGEGGATTATTSTTASATESTTTTTSSACSVIPCPAGAFDQCETSDTVTMCCNGSEMFAACSRAAGILTHVCPSSCTSGECTVAPDGGATCCAFTDDGGAGPCDVGGGK